MKWSHLPYSQQVIPAPYPTPGLGKALGKYLLSLGVRSPCKHGVKGLGHSRKCSGNVVSAIGWPRSIKGYAQGRFVRAIYEILPVLDQREMKATLWGGSLPVHAPLAIRRWTCLALSHGKPQGACARALGACPVTLEGMLWCYLTKSSWAHS